MHTRGFSWVGSPPRFGPAPIALTVPASNEHPGFCRMPGHALLSQTVPCSERSWMTREVPEVMSPHRWHGAPDLSPRSHSPVVADVGFVVFSPHLTATRLYNQILLGDANRCARIRRGRQCDRLTPEQGMTSTVADGSATSR